MFADNILTLKPTRLRQRLRRGKEGETPVKETTKKIFADDVPQEALNAAIKAMKDEGWFYTSASLHNIVLTFEREIPEPPATKDIEAATELFEGLAKDLNDQGVPFLGHTDRLD